MCYPRSGSVTIGVPPKLQFLKLTEASNFRFNAKHVHVVNSTLTHLYLNDNNLRQFPFLIRGLETVLVMDLGYNDLQVPLEFFDRFTSLKALYLFQNNLKSQIETESQKQLLGNLHNLEILILGNNRISKLSPIVFQNNSKMKILNLGLTKLGCRIDHMVNLKELDLQKNSLAYLDQNAIKDIETVAKHHHLDVRLNANPLVCSCESLAFLKWTISASPNIKLVRINNMSCTSEMGNLSLSRREAITRELEIRCASYVGLIVVLSLTILASVMIISGGLVYRYRWKLRYIYHIRLLRLFLKEPCQHVRQRYTPLLADEDDEIHDAFIAYADGNRQFVIKQMLPVLEDQQGLKLYIRDRDSIPGLEIATNITRGVSMSAVTILVLSRQFLASHWCNYEFQMARIEGVLRHTDVLLFLMSEEIPGKEFPDDILRAMRAGKHIELPGDIGKDDDDMNVFWTILLREIKSARQKCAF